MPPVSLASLYKGARGVVSEVCEDAQSLGDEAQSTISRRLLELGFVPGEIVEVVEQVWPGGDPMAVRLGVEQFFSFPRFKGLDNYLVFGPVL